MATQQKATARKTPAKKAPAKKTAAKRATPKKSADFSVKQSAEKAVNIYLGVIGKGIDTIQENIESTRKENDKRMKDLEKRGAKFRKELSKRFDKFEVSDVVDDTKAQFEKIQDQVEEAVDNVKDKLSSSKAANTLAPVLLIRRSPVVRDAPDAIGPVSKTLPVRVFLCLQQTYGHLPSPRLSNEPFPTSVRHTRWATSRPAPGSPVNRTARPPPFYNSCRKHSLWHPALPVISPSGHRPAHGSYRRMD